MTEPDTNPPVIHPPLIDPPPILPDTEEFAAYHQRRIHLFTLLTCVLSLLAVGACFVVGSGSLIMPFVLFAILAILIVIWHYPTATVYLVFFATATFELFDSNKPYAYLEKVPFFWNINTIFQTYAHVDFKALPINLMELILLLTVACAGIRAIFDHKRTMTLGPLFWPIVAYIAFVVFGWINGMSTGGDFKISLQEVRPQFYFLTAYFMVVNVISTPRHLHTLYWIMVLSIGLKGILYTIRRYTIYAGMPLPDQGVGSHEEAFLFDCFMMLLVVLSCCGLQKRLRAVMWFLLPFVVLGNLATNRRAGTAALILVFPILLLVAHRVLPKRRKFISALSLAVAILGPIYYYTFRHSDSALAQPARAIASQFEANVRDTNSNAYRDAENADLMATIHLAPIHGYGYGKKMLHAVPIADISKEYEWWDIMTHNQVLWVWMRVGTVGMLAFWMMVSTIIIQACQIIRSETASLEMKAAGIFSTMVICMLMLFGLLDMQFTNYRDMLFGGFCAGIIAIIPRLTPSLPTQEKEITP